MEPKITSPIDSTLISRAHPRSGLTHCSEAEALVHTEACIGGFEYTKRRAPAAAPFDSRNGHRAAISSTTVLRSGAYAVQPDDIPAYEGKRRSYRHAVDATDE